MSSHGLTDFSGFDEVALVDEPVGFELVVDSVEPAEDDAVAGEPPVASEQAAQARTAANTGMITRMRLTVFPLNLSDIAGQTNFVALALSVC